MRSSSSSRRAMAGTGPSWRAGRACSLPNSPTQVGRSRTPRSSAVGTSPSGLATITIATMVESPRTRSSWIAPSQSRGRLDASLPRRPRPGRSSTLSSEARRRGDATSHAGSGRPELTEQRARAPGVGGLEAFGEPRVHGLEEIARLLVPALLVQEPREPAGDGELPPPGPLRPGDVEPQSEAGLGRHARVGAAGQEGELALEAAKLRLVEALPRALDVGERFVEHAQPLEGLAGGGERLREKPEKPRDPQHCARSPVALEAVAELRDPFLLLRLRRRHRLDPLQQEAVPYEPVGVGDAALSRLLERHVRGLAHFGELATELAHGREHRQRDRHVEGAAARPRLLDRLLVAGERLVGIAETPQGASQIGETAHAGIRAVLAEGLEMVLFRAEQGEPVLEVRARRLEVAHVHRRHADRPRGERAEYGRSE